MRHSRTYAMLTALLPFFSQKFSLLKLCDPAFREIFRFFDAEDAARLAPCKDDKSEGQKFIKCRAYGVQFSYAYLLKCEDRKTFKCWPSYKTIGKALNVSKNTVRKYVESLYEKQLIDIDYTYVYTKDGKKLNGNLEYTIRPIQEAINYDLEKQFERNALIIKRAEAEKKFQEYMKTKNKNVS